MPSLGDFTPFDSAAAEAERTEPDTFGLCGEEFAVAEEISLIPLMRLAKAASLGLESSTMDGLAALHDFLEQALAEGEFPRFCDVALRNRVGHEGIFDVATKVYAAIAGRPTRRQSSSSGGLPGTSPTSRHVSSQLLRNVGLAADDELVSPEEAARLLRAV